MEFWRKYGVQTTIEFPVIKRAVQDFAISTDWTPAAADCKITKDGGNVANTTNAVAAVGGSGSALWSLTLTATEMQAARITVQIVDAATKVIEDQALIITTYGHASATHTGDINNLDAAISTRSAPATAQTITADQNVNVNKWLTATPNALQSGRVDSYVGAILAAVVTAIQSGLSTVTTAQVNAECDTALSDYDGPTDTEMLAAFSALLAALNNLSAAQVNAEVDTALADIDLDHLVKVTIGAGNPTVGSLLDKILNKSAGQTFDPTTDSLEAIVDSGGGAPTVGQIADAIWEELDNVPRPAGSFGQKFRQILTWVTPGIFR